MHKLTHEAKALFDTICGWLETHDEYANELNTAEEDAPSEEVVDLAVKMLRKVGYPAVRKAATIVVRKR